MKYVAAFFEAFDKEEKLLREFLPNDVECFFTWKTIQEYGVENPPAPIVSMRTQSLIPTEWGNKIDALISRSTGFDHLTEYLARIDKNITSAYLPDYAGRAVAEQAMLLWSALSRKLQRQCNSFDTFNRNEMTGFELVKRKITILGVGRIGSQIVDIAKGLRMDVVGVDIEPRNIDGLNYLSMEEGIKRAEIVVCALPLTDITRGMLNYNLLSNLSPDSIFVNIARGEVSPSGDILKLLEEGILAGAALDVYEYEKELAGVLRDETPTSHIKDNIARESVEATLAMRKRDDVILTPHNAFNTVESVERKSEQTVQNVLEYLKTGQFLTPIS